MSAEDMKETPPGVDQGGAQENGHLGETGSEAQNKPNGGDSQGFDFSVSVADDMSGLGSARSVR